MKAKETQTQIKATTTPCPQQATVLSSSTSIMSPQRNSNTSTDTANEEWPEIQTFAFASLRLAPANPTPKVAELNSSISAQDLESLKKRDPFLYYSIPGVRDATVRKEHEVDMHQVAQNGLKRHCQSCPASMQTSLTSEPVAKVTRCTRISFECHTDLLLDLDELSNDFADIDMGKAPGDLFPEEEDDEAFDSLFKLLERSWKQEMVKVWRLCCT